MNTSRDVGHDSLGSPDAVYVASPWFVLWIGGGICMFLWIVWPSTVPSLAFAAALGAVLAHSAVTRITFHERGFAHRGLLGTRSVLWRELTGATFHGVRLNGVFTIRTTTVTAGEVTVRIGSALPEEVHARIAGEASLRGVFRNISK